ncbi:kynureninase [Jiulongibacter sediminis]|uniref:kynureninase n=1 Tax=Jiulongibacter sediminis TaxID=1605367 RepID=UPI0026F242A1|nr:aminotransferase class V-fold PLP-dependent enzyme [Jiulongibacter sediminis]
MNLREIAQQKDRLSDGPGRYKDHFEIPDQTIYLDGNSLGPPLIKSLEVVKKTTEEEWKNRLIRSWNEDWLESWERISHKIATLINAEPGEVIVTDSVSVNLYKLAFAAIALQQNRKEILTDNLNFPSDIYVLQGLTKNHFQAKILNILEQKNEDKVEENILNHINSETALVTFSHVSFQSARRYQMAEINQKSKAFGAINLWDFSHSIGAVPIDVKASGVDLAVGCTYKYLNGGPGAPAFLFVRKELQKQLQNPIQGWFSHQNPFEFGPSFKRKENAWQFAVGTPSVISLKAIEPGLDLHLKAGSTQLWEESKELFEYFLLYFQNFLKERIFSISTPSNPEFRGSHIALHHPEAYRINLSLIHPRTSEKTFITDHRPPDIIRIALTPLYLGFKDVADFCERLMEIIDSKEYENHSSDKLGVI